MPTDPSKFPWTPVGNGFSIRFPFPVWMCSHIDYNGSSLSAIAWSGLSGHVLWKGPELGGHPNTACRAANKFLTKQYARIHNGVLDTSAVVDKLAGPLFEVAVFKSRLVGDESMLIALYKKTGWEQPICRTEIADQSATRMRLLATDMNMLLAAHEKLLR